VQSGAGFENVLSIPAHLWLLCNVFSPENGRAGVVMAFVDRLNGMASSSSFYVNHWLTIYHYHRYVRGLKCRSVQDTGLHYASMSSKLHDTWLNFHFKHGLELAKRYIFITHDMRKHRERSQKTPTPSNAWNRAHTRKHITSCHS
jgi:hypothetical protein